MEKSEIILIAQDILNTTTYTLDSRSAYQIYKFKKEILEFTMDIRKSRFNILREVFGDTYQKDLDWLNKNRNSKSADVNKIKDLEKKEKDASQKIIDLLNETVEITSIKPISYEYWHLFKKENFNKDANEGIQLNPLVEVLLENIL